MELSVGRQDAILERGHVDTVMEHLASLEPYRLQDLHARLRQAAAEPVT